MQGSLHSTNKAISILATVSCFVVVENGSAREIVELEVKSMKTSENTTVHTSMKQLTW